MKSQKVIVGMSGGVDSSVAAKLLLDQGYEVEGLFMKNWDEDDGTEYCTAIADLEDAQSVADTLKIPLHTANFAAEYWDNVFEYFLSEYRALRTPNPDVLCNREIKFKVFLEYAEMLGGDYIATGHYARCVDGVNGTELHKGDDAQKDQSYFLHAVPQHALAKTLFPLGELTKTEIRQLAEQYGFCNSQKKDSTGICFIGERRFKDFLATYLPARPGNIVTTEGILVGEHDGLMYYTYGQRQGLGIGGVANHNDLPWYVVEKRVETNELVVAQGEHNALYHSTLRVSELTFINPEFAADSFKCHAKTRYRQPDQACAVNRVSDAWEVTFEEPQRAVTPGQYLVLYQGSHCLGGGVIECRF